MEAIRTSCSRRCPSTPRWLWWLPGRARPPLDELLAVLGARSLDELAEFVRDVAARALADLSGSGGGPLVAFACGVWHDEKVKLKPDYCAAAVEVYNAETRAVDFRKKVSSHAASDMIDGLIGSDF
jgi:hypothetical protein